MIHIKDTTTSTGTPVLTTGEVAYLYGVDPKTVARWATTGALPQDSWFRTPGGRRRYHADAITALINGSNGNGAVK